MHRAKGNFQLVVCTYICWKMLIHASFVIYMGTLLRPINAGAGPHVCIPCLDASWPFKKQNWARLLNHFLLFPWVLSFHCWLSLPLDLSLFCLAARPGLVPDHGLFLLIPSLISEQVWPWLVSWPRLCLLLRMNQRYLTDTFKAAHWNEWEPDSKKQ